MKDYVSKCHMRDRTVLIDEYPNSPHVRNKIANGQFTLCRQQTGINSTFTDSVYEVTCKRCLERAQGGLM